MTDSTRYEALDAIVPESLADKAARLEAEQAADLETLADAVLAERDQRVEQLEAERDQLEQRCAWLGQQSDRAWDLVKLWRLEAVKRGEDPYSDPKGQALSAALVGIEHQEAAVDAPKQYEQVLAKDAEAAPPVRDRVAARRDPRYAAVLAEIAGFGWPAGNPMVPGSWADAMATRVMAAIRAEEA